jgi:general secretion pathway protein I
VSSGSHYQVAAERGFTLIEMTVALAIFGLAALALLRLEGATVASTGHLHDRAIGQIVARNVAVLAMTDPVAPGVGTAQGIEDNGGQPWRWTRVTKPSPTPEVLQIEISVTDTAGRPAGALTIFRPVT